MMRQIQTRIVGIPGLLVLGLVIGLLVAAACGSDSTSEPAAPQQPVQAVQSEPAASGSTGPAGMPQQPAQPQGAAMSAAAQTQLTIPTPAPEVVEARRRLTGTIEIDGSSTVFPITEAVAEEFGKVAPDVHVNVGVSGSGGGFKRFTVGETDISDASRPIKVSEAATAQENGVEYLEFLVGVDGLSVTVSHQNDFVDCMSVEQLKQLWEPGSTIGKWSDLDPTWPDRDISLYGPGHDSGTFDYFTEEIVGEAQASRADFTASEDDNVLVRGISGDRNSLGYLGYAYYAENTDKLKLLGIDNGQGCVTPSLETIASGAYSPLSRPLSIYVNRQRLQQRADLRAFVEFYMENGRELTAEVGYVPLSEASYAANLSVAQGGLMPETPTMSLKGTIAIGGSPTVSPITETVAE